MRQAAVSVAYRHTAWPLLHRTFKWANCPRAWRWDLHGISARVLLLRNLGKSDTLLNTHSWTNIVDCSREMETTIVVKLGNRLNQTRKGSQFRSRSIGMLFLAFAAYPSLFLN